MGWLEGLDPVRRRNWELGGSKFRAGREMGRTFVPTNVSLACERFLSPDEPVLRLPASWVGADGTFFCHHLDPPFLSTISRIVSSEDEERRRWRITEAGEIAAPSRHQLGVFRAARTREVNPLIRSHTPDNKFCVCMCICPTIGICLSFLGPLGADPQFAPCGFKTKNVGAVLAETTRRVPSNQADSADRQCATPSVYFESL